MKRATRNSSIWDHSQSWSAEGRNDGIASGGKAKSNKNNNDALEKRKDDWSYAGKIEGNSDDPDPYHEVNTPDQYKTSNCTSHLISNRNKELSIGSHPEEDGDHQTETDPKFIVDSRMNKPTAATNIMLLPGGINERRDPYIPESDGTEGCRHKDDTKKSNENSKWGKGGQMPAPKAVTLYMSNVPLSKQSTPATVPTVERAPKKSKQLVTSTTKIITIPTPVIAFSMTRSETFDDDSTGFAESDFSYPTVQDCKKYYSLTSLANENGYEDKDDDSLDHYDHEDIFTDVVNHNDAVSRAGHPTRDVSYPIQVIYAIVKVLHVLLYENQNYGLETQMSTCTVRSRFDN